MLHTRWTRLIGFTAVGIFLFGSVHWISGVRSANLTEVSVTLSTPRLSFRGELDGSNAVGSSVVTIEDDPTAVAAGITSTSSANLFEGDTVLIGYNGTPGTGNQYQVASVSATNSFTITNVPTGSWDTLQTGDVDDGDQVIASRSATLTAKFKTVTAVPNGQFRVLVPAADTNNNDSIPDADGWDYGTTVDAAVTVNCPDDLPGYSFGTNSATSGITYGGQTYHAFVCEYTGTGGNNTDFTGDNYDITIDNLINPAPASDHSEGYADTYRIIVQHLDSGGTNVIDQTSVSVAVIESVRVTASVPPQISFRILGVDTADKNTVCGVTNSVDTTPTLVPLGELLIDNFTNAAQELVVSTNAQNGYTVTAAADNQLHRVGEACAGDATEANGGCIQDAEGNTPNADMSHTLATAWTQEAAKGFAFSLEDNTLDVDADGLNGTNDSIPFTHSSPGGTGRTNCTDADGNCWRQFADQDSTSAEDPQTIFSSSTVADTDAVYVCYRAVVSATQQAGSDYSTAITYRATATF